jgi:peroxiredoxin-like protein
MQTITLPQHKTFTWRTFSEWMGGKAAKISAAAKPSIRITSPEEFHGEKNAWTPEDLFIGSIETCLLMTFAAIAEKRELEVDAYYSESAGLLEFTEGQYRFTHVVIHPTIVVADDAAIEPALKAIEDAHRRCSITNSLLTKVIVEPEVRLRHAA